MQEKFCTRVSIITSKGCAAHSSWYSSVQKSHVLTFFPPINLDLSAFTGALFKNSFKYFPHGVTRLKGCSLRMFPRCLCLHLKNVALWWRFIKVQKKNIILLSFCGWLGLLEKKISLGGIFWGVGVGGKWKIYLILGNKKHDTLNLTHF